MNTEMVSGKLWIDGKECEAASNEQFATPNPATGQTLTTLARAKKEDVDRAVRSARRAFTGPWAKMSGPERAKILWKAGELILEQTKTLARLETLDAGKLLANTTQRDIPLSAETFFYFSGWAGKIYGDTIPVGGPFLNYTLREPLGVIAAITPWNFPLLLASRKVAPALAAGNVIILKPSEEASLTSLALGKILLEAGLPEGVCNVVTGYGEEAGAALVEHPDVDKISFTGGTITGRHIMRSASSTLKKLSLELGGKNPHLIFADANITLASKVALSGIFYNQGQVCTAGSRLLVEASIKDQVLENLITGTQKISLGDPMDPKTNMGPLVSNAQKERVLGYIQKGIKEGATKETGGENQEGKGFFVSPTIFSNVSSEMAIAKEEIFGPVLSVFSFETIEEAIQLANETDYGLAAGIWTKDVSKAHSFAAKVKAGTVWVNTYGKFDAASPYGGYKQSGFGRENGRQVLDELTQTKSVWISLQ